MNCNFNLRRKFSRFVEQEKKLAVKVIAGVMLLAVAFVFYLVKDISADRDMAVTLISENGTESSMEPERSGHSAKAGTGTGAGTDGEADLIANAETETIAAALEVKNVIVVDVAGAVTKPSVLELPEGSRVFEAVEKAGGLTEEADTELINRAAVLTDGQKIYIPTKKEAGEIRRGQPPAAIQYVPGISDTGTGQSKLININTADSAALQQLTGIGPATAEKIINYRRDNGSFKTIEDIKNVSGIGDKTFEKFKDKITI